MANQITTLQAENLQGVQEKFLSNSQEGPWAQKLPVPPSDSKMASITKNKSHQNLPSIVEKYSEVGSLH